MIYPRNICSYLRKSPYCSSKRASIQSSKRGSSFDIDAVIKNHEKWMECMQLTRARESDSEVYR
ncbi:unnamed protein product [Brugia timori]|nr:unnamed protein product [Brugia timori]